MPSATVGQVQVQQLRERFVLADVRIPAIGRSHGRIERSRNVSQPVGPVVAEIGEGALPELPGRRLVTGHGALRIARRWLVHPL